MWGVERSPTPRGGTDHQVGRVGGTPSIFGGVVFNNDGTLSVDVGKVAFRLRAGLAAGRLRWGSEARLRTLFNHTLASEDSEGDECRGGGVGQRGGRRRFTAVTGSTTTSTTVD